MSYVIRLILSNVLSFVSFLFIVFYSINTNRKRRLGISLLMMILQIAVYVIIEHFDAAVATLFGLLRNYLCMKYTDRKDGLAVKIAILAVGTAFSAWCASQSGGTLISYLPAVSFLFSSCGYYLTKSSGALRVIDAADITVFWLAFDFLNLMAFNVVIDLFVVLFPFAERYVKLDKTDSSVQRKTDAAPELSGR
ncbi:MAG: YgjV family protein [Ruminiclostridium sp.]|nr:YgjV family protein [Ruminiclostridium sp.]